MGSESLTDKNSGNREKEHGGTSRNVTKTIGNMVKGAKMW